MSWYWPDLGLFPQQKQWLTVKNRPVPRRRSVAPSRCGRGAWQRPRPPLPPRIAPHTGPGDCGIGVAKARGNPCPGLAGRPCAIGVFAADGRDRAACRGTRRAARVVSHRAHCHLLRAVPPRIPPAPTACALIGFIEPHGPQSHLPRNPPDMGRAQVDQGGDLTRWQPPP